MSNSVLENPTQAQLLESIQNWDPVVEADGIPRIYQHEICGQTTQLPEDVIQKNLIDPRYYNLFTYCSGCDQNWHQSGFSWVATRENLGAYQTRLYQNKSNAYKVLAWSTNWLGVPVILGTIGFVASLILGSPIELLTGLGVLAGVVIGLGPAKHLRLAIAKLLD